MRFFIHTPARKFTVPAVAGTLGKGTDAEREALVPCHASVRAGLPHKWRKAFDRSGGAFFFEPTKHGARAHCRLNCRRGGYLATIYAIPENNC